jgi:hypothetical protein
MRKIDDGFEVLCKELEGLQKRLHNLGLVLLEKVEGHEEEQEQYIHRSLDKDDLKKAKSKEKEAL